MQSDIKQINDLVGREAVTIEALRATGLVGDNRPVKILGNGEITKKLTVEANKFSASAKEKIENAGGTAKEV